MFLLWALCRAVLSMLGLRFRVSGVTARSFHDAVRHKDKTSYLST